MNNTILAIRIRRKKVSRSYVIEVLIPDYNLRGEDSWVNIHTLYKGRDFSLHWLFEPSGSETEGGLGDIYLSKTYTHRGVAQNQYERLIKKIEIYLSGETDVIVEEKIFNVRNN